MAMADRIISAATKFVTNNGWYVFYTNPRAKHVNIVATDENDELHFIKVGYRNGNESVNCDYPSREQAEDAAIEWLTFNNDLAVDAPAHFDMFQLAVTAPHRAFLKAHYDCLD